MQLIKLQCPVIQIFLHRRYKCGFSSAWNRNNVQQRRARIQVLLAGWKDKLVSIYPEIKMTIWREKIRILSASWICKFVSKGGWFRGMKQCDRPSTAYCDLGPSNNWTRNFENSLIENIIEPLPSVILKSEEVYREPEVNIACAQDQAFKCKATQKLNTYITMKDQ